MAMAKKKHVTSEITNRRARFDYEIKDSFIAGIVLSGAETRSLRQHHGSLQGAFVQIKDGEAWLFNAQIMPVKTNAANLPTEAQTRNRKLLLKKRELDQLIQAKQQGLTIVPLRFFITGRFIKLEIATGRGKKKYDKRQTIKLRETKRELSRKRNE